MGRRSYCFESKKVALRSRGRFVDRLGRLSFVAKTIRTPSRCFPRAVLFTGRSFRKVFPFRPSTVSARFNFFSLPLLSLERKKKSKREEQAREERRRRREGWGTPRLFPNFSSVSKLERRGGEHARTLWQKIVSNRHTNDSW
mgnify:CR=1 FL=1